MAATTGITFYTVVSLILIVVPSVSAARRFDLTSTSWICTHGCQTPVTDAHGRPVCKTYGPKNENEIRSTALYNLIPRKDANDIWAKAVFRYGSPSKSFSFSSGFTAGYVSASSRLLASSSSWYKSTSLQDTDVFVFIRVYRDARGDLRLQTEYSIDDWASTGGALVGSDDQKLTAEEIESLGTTFFSSKIGDAQNSVSEVIVKHFETNAQKLEVQRGEIIPLSSDVFGRLYRDGATRVNDATADDEVCDGVEAIHLSSSTIGAYYPLFFNRSSETLAEADALEFFAKCDQGTNIYWELVGSNPLDSIHNGRLSQECPWERAQLRALDDDIVYMYFDTTGIRTKSQLTCCLSFFRPLYIGQRQDTLHRARKMDALRRERGATMSTSVGTTDEENSALNISPGLDGVSALQTIVPVISCVVMGIVASFCLMAYYRRQGRRSRNNHALSVAVEEIV